MKKYIAKNGVIREVNPYPEYSSMRAPKGLKDAILNKHIEFEQSIQSYATDLPDGEYFESEIVFNPKLDMEMKNIIGYFVTAKPKESEVILLSDEDELLVAKITNDIIGNNDINDSFRNGYKQGCADTKAKVIEAIDSKISKFITNNKPSKKASAIENTMYDIRTLINNIKP